VDAQDLIRNKLETLKESIVEFKFAIDSLQDRANDVETEIDACQHKLDELKYASVLNGQIVSSIQNRLQNMDSDIRSVRNSILSAISAAVIIGVVGTALTINNYNHQYPARTSIGKNP
jgi:chromosome segregation ATPase